MKKLILCIGLVGALSAQAALPAGAASFEEHPRVLVWGSERVWQTDKGQIMVCTWQYHASYNQKWCYEEVESEGGKRKIDRWSLLEDYTIDGYKLTAYEFKYSGGSTALMTYFSPVGAKSSKAQPITLTGPVTVKVNKIVVQPRARR